VEIEDRPHAGTISPHPAGSEHEGQVAVPVGRAAMGWRRGYVATLSEEH
jgi:hypothetical protein